MSELIKLRKSKGISRQQLATHLECSLRQVYRYEYQQCDVPLATAIKWAKKLKLSMNQFVTLYI